LERGRKAVGNGGVKGLISAGIDCLKLTVRCVLTWPELALWPTTPG
jgi:hypothetical protein